MEFYRAEKARAKKQYFDNLVRTRHHGKHPLMKHSDKTDPYSFELAASSLMHKLQGEEAMLQSFEKQLKKDETDLKVYQLKSKKANNADIMFQNEMIQQLYRIAYPNTRSLKD